MKRQKRIEKLIRNHYQSYWNLDPDVDMEDLFITLHEDTFDLLKELEEDRKNLEKAWRDFYPETDARHWMSVEPTLELVFLRSLFPSTFQRWLSDWGALVCVSSEKHRHSAIRDRRATAKEKQNDIWENVLETYREIYREIHNQEPQELKNDQHTM
tara:strand:- start:638 stop:1105 length:468 start_codon:yes stop_codon:yes gene_type:complete